MSQIDACILAQGYEDLGFGPITNSINNLIEEGYTPDEAFNLLGICY